MAPDETTTIADPDDPRLDDYRRLNEQAARRRIERDEFFITEGYVAIDRLIESGHTIRSVVLAPSRVERFRPHLGALADRSVPVFVAERDVIASAIGFDLHRGVLASADRRDHPSVENVAASTRRVAVLEGLNDAENLGAIARAARALGIEAFVTDPTCTDPYSRRTVRVSMGEVLTLPIATTTADRWPSVLDVLHGHGFETWAMTPAADADDLWALDVPERVAVVFGAEGPGLDARTVAAADRRVRIPISADVDSLNVGHAAAITFAAIGRPR
ncbi:MAG: RNA methyltransferase [Ilumatobacter sp.]|nr:RNA methyltransferase [Ilumatobacter sp.]